MGRKFFGAIVGLLVSYVIVGTMVLLATGTDLIVFTDNKFQLFLMLFFILILAAISTEAIVRTVSVELIIDAIFIIILSIILLGSGFDFVGGKTLSEYFKSFFWPIALTTIFSAFISNWTYQKIKKK